MLSKRGLITAAVVVGLSGSAMLPAAFAQETTDETVTGSEDRTPVHEQRHAERRAEFAAALAEELSLDEDTVAAAITEVRMAMAESRRAERLAALEERLDAAVEDGTMTREQADVLLAAREAGVLNRGLGRHGGAHGFGGHPAGAGGSGGFLQQLPPDDDAA